MGTRTMTDTVSSADSITALLKNFQQSRVPLQVGFDKKNVAHTSYLVSMTDNWLHIDQLIPKEGNQQLKPGDDLTIQVSHGGTLYQFKSRHLSPTIEEDGFPCHKIAFPQQLDFSEQRTSFRVPIRREQAPSVNILTHDGQRLHAQLENISDNGLCIRLHVPQTISDTQLVHCEINFTDFEPLSLDAQVRHNKAAPQVPASRIGMEFSSLSSLTRKQLSQWLMKLQRHHIRTGLPA